MAKGLISIGDSDKSHFSIKQLSTTARYDDTVVWKRNEIVLHLRRVSLNTRYAGNVFRLQYRATLRLTPECNCKKEAVFREEKLVYANVCFEPTAGQNVIQRY